MLIQYPLKLKQETRWRRAAVPADKMGPKYGGAEYYAEACAKIENHVNAKMASLPDGAGLTFTAEYLENLISDTKQLALILKFNFNEQAIHVHKGEPLKGDEMKVLPWAVWPAADTPTEYLEEETPLTVGSLLDRLEAMGAKRTDVINFSSVPSTGCPLHFARIRRRDGGIILLETKEADEIEPDQQ